MSSDAGSAIAIRDLCKVFTKGRSLLFTKGHNVVRAVDGVTLEVRRGEIFGLLGPNGAGKTTMLEICEGLQEPTSGEVSVLGHSWRERDTRPLRQRIGVSLQETRFFEKQTVREVLTLFATFYDDARSADEAIALVSLEEKANARTPELSGGQRQRLAVACALICRPDLLFLDEPTTGLDPQSRRHLWDVVRAFQACGGTALLTTHYMEEAEQLCDRVGVVDHGKLIALGTPRELIASLGGEHVVSIAARGIGRTLDLVALQALPGVTSHRIDEAQLSLTVRAPHLALPPLLQLLASNGLAMEGLSTHQTSLEDVFMNLTGRHLRDGSAQER